MGKQSRSAGPQALETALLQKSSDFYFDKEIRALAERLKQETIAQLSHSGDMCEEKQKLMDSIEVVPGRRKGEYLVVSQGEYGRNLEFGTRNSPESPWFTPSFVTLAGLIEPVSKRCFTLALKKARRLHIS